MSTRNHLVDLTRLSPTTPEELAAQARSVFREGGAYEMRYQMALLAPQHVVDRSDLALRSLRDYRNAVLNTAADPHLSELDDRLIDSIKSLQAAMRTDLEVEA